MILQMGIAMVGTVKIEFKYGLGRHGTEGKENGKRAQEHQVTTIEL